MQSDNLHNLLFEKSAGFLQLSGARMALLDIEAGFWGIRRQIEALIGTHLTNTVLQQAGANGGASFARSFSQQTDLERSAIFRACVQAYQLAGFGQFEITALEWPVGRIEIQATQAFEAWMLQQHNEIAELPICAYSAGVFVGFINVLSQRQDVVCIEHTCQARGDETCTFELIPAAQAQGQAAIPFRPDPGLGRQLNLLELLFERMPMGIAIFDQQYTIQRYNLTWADFADRYAPPSPHRLTPGVFYFDLFPGAEDIIVPLFERVLAGETINESALRFESGGIVSYWDVVLAPLMGHGKVNGILNVTSDATERVLLQQNLEQRVEERTQEAERRRQVAESLRDIIATINSSRSLTETLAFIVAQANRVMRSQACLVHHIEDSQDFVSIQASDGLPSDLESIPGFPLHSSPKADDRILNRKPVWTNDFRKNPSPTEDQLAALHPDVRAWRELTDRYYRAWLAIPLVVNGQVYGSLAFYFDQPKEFDEEEIQLSQSFADQAALAIENTRLYEAEQERQRELQILLDVASAANSSLDLNEILGQSLDLIVDLVGASRAGVALVNESTGELAIKILRPEQKVDPVDLEKMLRVGQLVITSGEMQYISPDDDRELFEPGALLPLKIRGHAFGVLGIIGMRGGAFTPQQLALFKSIADQLGVAIENARLFENAEDVAIATERNRLARDLHDAVTQTLFSSTMIAEVLPKIWERNPDEGKRRLEELRQLTRGALSEMRTLLVELRPSALVDTDLGDLIGHQVNAFIARTRLPVEFDCNCKYNPPTEVKEMFYRIAQEALNNIAKHADATQVMVKLNCQKGETELTVQDDGVGFDLKSAQSEGLGLSIMEERARNLGARYEMHSRIHEGTRLSIFWQDPNHEEYNNE